MIFKIQKEHFLTKMQKYPIFKVVHHYGTLRCIAAKYPRQVNFPDNHVTFFRDG